MGGREWRVLYVDPDDPALVDRTGTLTLATTDPETSCVYVSTALSGDMLRRVLVHELGHCAIVSYGLDADIRRMCHPRYWVEAEEFVCNFLADYGQTVFESARAVLGDVAIYTVVPAEMCRLVA